MNNENWELVKDATLEGFCASDEEIELTFSNNCKVTVRGEGGLGYDAGSAYLKTYFEFFRQSLIPVTSPARKTQRLVIQFRDANKQLRTFGSRVFEESNPIDKREAMIELSFMLRHHGMISGEFLDAHFEDGSKPGHPITE